VAGRLGILRESFSLPGVSLSASYRSLGSLELWDVQRGDPAGAAFDLGVSSVRAVLGKDLWGIGFLAGAGWERYSGAATLTVLGTPGSEIDGSASGDLESDRRLYFFGASMTFIAIQISAEAGWARGFDPTLPPMAESGFDPTSRSEFGALSLRLTF
jgi:hypothetical protein